MDRKLVTAMLCLTAMLTVSLGAFAQAASKPAAPSAPAASTPAASTPAAQATISSVVDRQVTQYEKLVIDVADAMPEDKYGFNPESLGIKGAAFTGVRTFAELIKHTATANYVFWTAVTGDAMPAGVKGPNGPDEIKTKADIVKYLKDSFALGHKAAAALNASNAAELLPFRSNKAARLYLTTTPVVHAADEYGQMVEYLRMSGIVPPASRSNP
jgi:hypothetical protein